MVTTTELEGRRLGVFQVGTLLGRGGMGAVFRGRDTALDRPVAIKVLAPHLAEDPEYVERFVREARTAARLNHPNVVQIYGAGFEQGTAYMALELVVGSSLFDLFARHRPFPPRTACELIRDAARGLAAAHALGIVHRDLKPENILVTPDGSPKLADFGLARSTNQRITASGVFLGTPQYASPEQCNGEEVTAASDLYSLGVVLYELLAGRPPHEAPTPLALFNKILSEAPPSLRASRTDLPASLPAIVDRLLRKAPAERCGSADELVRELEQVIPALPKPAAAEDPFSPQNRSSGRLLAGDGSAETNVLTVRSTTASALSAGVQAFGGGENDRETVLLDEATASGKRSASPERPAAPSMSGAGAAASSRSRSGRGRAAAVAAAVLVLAIVAAAASRIVPTERPDGVRVAVIGWSHGAVDPEFAWLEDALPEFVTGELAQLAPQVRVVSRAEVERLRRELGGKATTIGPELLERIGGDVWIGGTFYPVGDQVGIATTLQRMDGSPIRFEPQVRFEKAAVLEELAALAGRVREALAREAASSKEPATADRSQLALLEEEARVAPEEPQAESAPPPPQPMVATENAAPPASKPGKESASSDEGGGGQPPPPPSRTRAQQRGNAPSGRPEGDPATGSAKQEKDVAELVGDLAGGRPERHEERKKREAAGLPPHEHGLDGALAAELRRPGGPHPFTFPALLKRCIGCEDPAVLRQALEVIQEQRGLRLACAASRAKIEARLGGR